MGAFIYADCSCGRRLRATQDQAGTVIHCWECRREVVVPRAARKDLLIRRMADAAHDALRPPTLGVLLASAAIFTAALLVPRNGPWLALVLLAVASFWGYGGQMGTRVPERSPREDEAGTDPSSSGEEVDETIATRPLRVLLAWLARGVVALAASLALVAPVLVRNRGYALPPAGPAPGVRSLMALAFVGWLVLPLAMLAAFARDGRGPLPPWRPLARLARHPLATLAALLIVPLGLLATEGLLALVAWEQGQLPLMVVDLFPAPRLEHREDGVRFCFDLDGTVVAANCTENLDNLIPVYGHAVRRGFSLTGTLPASLSIGLVRRPAHRWMFRVGPKEYLATRIVLTFLVAWAGGTLLTIQARWLGRIASLDSA
jgi:hypothetical protein